MRTLSRMKVPIATILAAGLLLAGCGSNEEPENQMDETATQPVGQFSTERQQSDWQLFRDGTEGIYPTDIRAVTLDGFERIIIEHAGNGTPNYTAQYTEDPRFPDTEVPVVTGDAAYLEVLVSGTARFDELDEEQMIEHNTRITDLETEATRTVVSFVPWEETSTYVLGLDEQRPYAVTILEDPVRVVIDIQLAAPAVVFFNLQTVSQADTMAVA